MRSHPSIDNMIHVMLKISVLNVMSGLATDDSLALTVPRP